MTELDSCACIYCKNFGSSKEHVAPSSLGGNCVIRRVCKGCNIDLSAVDQALAENSPVALSKIGMTPTAAFTTQLGTIATMRDQRGFDLGVRVGNQMAVEVRPQIFLSGNQMSISCSNRKGIEELVRYIDARIGRGSLAAVHQRITPETRIPRLMMHRSDDAVVDAASSEEASQLLAVIEKNWSDVKAQLEKPDVGEIVQRATPSVLIKMTMLPNEEYRGVAKIAFETTALLLGSGFVLRDSFDPLRAYILGDVRLPAINGDDPEHPAIDSRFVARVAPEGSFQFTDQHGVILFHNPQHGLAALVVLYGMHHYRVKLAPPQDRSAWMRHYEFSYSKAGHGELSSLDFVRRALERFPHVLKIDPGIAAKMLEALNEESR